MTGAYLFAGVVGLLLVGAMVLGQVTSSAPIAEPTLINDEGVCCTLDGGVYVPADPAGLALGRAAEVNAYALGRVIQSEGGGLPWIAQVGIAWVVRNRAAEKNRTILAIVTRATLNKGRDDGTGDGFFGRQGHPVGGYRYVATSQDPTQDAIDTAAAVLAGDVDDPTEGGVNFDSPAAYGKQAGTDEADVDEFAANREKEGKESFGLPGVSMNRLRFWRYS